MDNQSTLSSMALLNIDLENYFSNTIIPQLFVDEKLILRKFTPPAMKQFNLTSADTGRAIGDLADNIRFPGIIDNIRQVIESGSILEKEIQTTDRRWYQMNILPYIVRQTGKTNGVIITFVDITTRIHDLKELEKLISDHQVLIDSISHDIKNPLTNILLALELVRNGGQSTVALTSGVEIIERATKRIQTMIDDLTTVRRESSIQTEAELLNVENILEDVCMALTIQLQEAQSIITSDFQVSELYFSRRKLRSVLFNLVSNAIKYRSHERPSEINISTFRENGRIAIRITDNGIGIAQDKHDAVFSKYYRVQDTIEGTGVGLYLVKEIIRPAGGNITVSSEPGKGSVFTVYIQANHDSL